MAWSELNFLFFISFFTLANWRARLGLFSGDSLANILEISWRIFWSVKWEAPWSVWCFPICGHLKAMYFKLFIFEKIAEIISFLSAQLDIDNRFSSKYSSPGSNFFVQIFSAQKVLGQKWPVLQTLSKNYKQSLNKLRHKLKKQGTFFSNFLFYKFHFFQMIF